MSFRIGRRRMGLLAVAIVVCVAIGMGLAALSTANAATGAMVGRGLVCCCQNQCVPAVNGKCPRTGCIGPFFMCPNTCGTALQ
jgi:hypothetical protein